MPATSDVKQSMSAWLVQMGDHHFELGQIDKAIDYYNQAMAVAQESVMQRHVLVGLAMSTLRIGDFDHASEYYEQALQLSPRSLSPQDTLSHSGETMLLMDLAKGYYRRGDIAKAIKSMEAAAAYAADLRDIQDTPGERLQHLARAYIGFMAAANRADHLDDCRAALAYGEQAGDEAIIATAQIGLALADILAGNPGAALNVLAGLVSRLYVLHEPMLEAETRAYYCLALAEVEQPGAALDAEAEMPERGSGSVSRRARCVVLTATGLAQTLMGQSHQALAACSEALAAAQEVSSSDPVGARMEARALLGIGMANGELGYLDEALSAYRAVQASADNTNEIGLRLRAMLGTGSALLPSNAGEARTSFQLTWETAHAGGAGECEANAVAGLALSEALSGNASEANRLIQTARIAAQSVNDAPAQCRVYLAASHIERTIGKNSDAIKYAQQALEHAQAHHLTGLERQALGSLGVALVESGDVSRVGQAVKYLENALDGERVNRQQQVVIGALGSAYTTIGEVQKAVELYSQAQSNARAAGNRHAEAVWLANLANLFAYLGHTKRAIEPYQQAIHISEELGDQAMQAQTQFALGLAYSDLDQLRDAVSTLKSARMLFAALGDQTSLAQVDDLLRQM
jgi:tetratricopeptide (TPR) repeat protein